MSDNAKQPALTICIPTYNRGKRVHSLVLFLKSNLLTRTDDVNVLVVDNCSNDGTEALITPLVDERVQFFKRTEFLDNAEKNMYASVELCTGEYIWFHGDDELPMVETVLELIKSIRADEADMFVFNSSVINDEGGLLATRMAPMRSLYVDVCGDALIQTAGFVFMLAGISNVVFKRSAVDVDVAWESQAVAPIYSHVCWFLISFAQKRSRIVNLPLVYYRNSAIPKQIKHFQKYAERLGVGDHYFWGLGVAQQLEYLVSKGAIQPGSVAKVIEGRRDGTRFRLLNEVIMRFYLQVVLSIETGEARQRIDPAVLKHSRDFLVSCDPFAYDLFEPIEKLNEIAMGQRSRSELRSIRKEFDLIFRQHDADPYRNHWCGTCFGFDLYNMPMGWVAIDPDVPGGIESVLQYIDIRQSPPYVWVSDSLEDLRLLLQKYAEDQAAQVPDSEAHTRTEIVKIGKELVEISRFVSSEYARTVQISLQTTMPIRLFTRAVLFPLRRVALVARRALGSVRRRLVRA
ncbi:glycosyltransferase family 2 protein [Pararobbsia silviterrae]|uniref:Glycosyltransferase family 2 protein n=1 Tax=Pararobbsia silviterrae TaxID=1792498 RepID=A0A494XDE2_9BURK|nr:glycosyltransferase family 2 protein [Pararobbsia silviterrae]RKP46179.1 glycosyltransferase family 2 protein [Pararobbsia silviterrae]